MTKEQTIAIMAILGAFYSGGKNDPKAQAAAWYMVLSKYDFETAQRAVVKFAENDTRDYATFPTVGKIVEAIRQEERESVRPFKEIKMAISYGRDYSTLSAESKALIGELEYEYWSGKDAVWFEQHTGQLYNILKENALGQNRNRLAAET